MPEPSTPSSPSTTPSRRIRVIAVDDHPAILEALGEVISTKMDMVLSGTATTVDEAFRLADEHRPDVTIMDIALRDAHGLDLVQNLRAQYPDVRVVVFSMYDESIYAERSIRAGASGYVMKSESTQTVVEAIRHVSQGEVYLSRRMASRMLSKLAHGGGPGPGFAVDALTDREIAVFQMLGQGHGIQQISDRLNLSRKTVETHRRRAKEKLGFESMAELLQFAVQWTYGQAVHK